MFIKSRSTKLYSHKNKHEINKYFFIQFVVSNFTHFIDKKTRIIAYINNNHTCVHKILFKFYIIL